MAIPPVGMKRTSGNGPRKAPRYRAPPRLAGNSFTMLAPAAKAPSTSVGLSTPGTVGTRELPSLVHDLGDRAPLTRKAAPAAANTRASSTVRIVPPDRRSRFASRGDGLQRSGRVGGDLDRVDPAGPQRVDDGSQVAGLPVADDREHSVVFERGHVPSLVLTEAGRSVASWRIVRKVSKLFREIEGAARPITRSPRGRRAC